MLLQAPTEVECESEVAVTVHLVSVLRRATVPPAPFKNVHPPPSHIR